MYPRVLQTFRSVKAIIISFLGIHLMVKLRHLRANTNNVTSNCDGARQTMNGGFWEITDIHNDELRAL